MYIIKLHWVTMETFVVQRCRSLPSSMGYTTLDQKEMEAMCAMCTCSGSKILMLGFSLEAKFVSSNKHLIQLHLEILSCSVETWLHTC